MHSTHKYLLTDMELSAQTSAPLHPVVGLCTAASRCVSCPCRVPLYPYLPAASLLLNCFLMASLPARAYYQLAIFFAVMLVFYLFYSVHAATRKETEGGVPTGTKAVGDVESPAATAPVGAAAGDVGKDTIEGPTRTLSDDARGSFTRSSSLIDRINTHPGERGSVLGRRSAGITRLPPPTL